MVLAPQVILLQDKEKVADILQAAIQLVMEQLATILIQLLIIEN